MKEMAWTTISLIESWCDNGQPKARLRFVLDFSLDRINPPFLREDWSFVFLRAREKEGGGETLEFVGNEEDEDEEGSGAAGREECDASAGSDISKLSTAASFLLNGVSWLSVGPDISHLLAYPF